MTKIAVIVGSLRQESFNKQLAHVIEKLLPEDVEFVYADISDFPLFNQDNEADYPAAAQAAKDQIAEADGVLIVTPEYNRSVPVVLKNAIDWLSRPYEQNPFDNKPVAVAGTGGVWGTTFAQTHLKATLLYLDAKVLGQPEVYVARASSMFEAKDTITDERTIEFLQKFVDRFLQHITSN